MEIPVVSIKDAEPKCRCDFVLKWLDDHLPYFPPPPPTPRLITRLCGYTYAPPQMYYYYSQPVQTMCPPRNIQLPYIVPAPHRISPLRPTYQ